MAGNGGGRGAHALGLRPPPRPGVPAAQAEERRGPRHAGFGEGRKGLLLLPQAPLGTGDSESPPNSRGLQQLTHGLSLVRWALERRAGGRAGAPPPRLPQPGARPARRRACPRPVPLPLASPAARCGLGPGTPADLMCQNPRAARAGRDGWGRLRLEGQAHHPGTPGTQVPFGDIPVCKTHVC
ncbi:uncharacterized protein WM277_027805 [Molossus nigricans]